MVPITSSIVRPRFKPKVKIAISTAINVAITGSPKNSAKRSRLWPFGSTISATARSAIRITGTNEVATLMPKLGISSSVKIFGLYRPSGTGLSMPFRKRA
ncbi:hypothetical protein D3C72_1636990 [compost metagenome]